MDHQNNAVKGGLQMDHQNNQETKPKDYSTPKLITYGNLLEITAFAVKKSPVTDNNTTMPKGKSPVT